MFDIHKVKPIHGWREFVGEVGIIVLGVLIALGAEQIVEALHWRHEVESGREAVTTDLETIAGEAFERDALSACLGRRLQDIAAIIDGASRSGQLPPVGPIGSPGKRLWHLQSWNSLTAAQIATHFPKKDMLALGTTDAYLGEVAALNVQEINDWTVLWTIVGPGRRLAVGEEPQLRQALSHATYEAKLMRLASLQINEDVDNAHLLDADRLAAIRRQSAIDNRKMVARNTVCLPIGPAPAHYGDSPLKMDLTAPLATP